MEDFRNHNIVFYDGQCFLCSASVRFIAKRDKKKKIFFSSLQSNIAKCILSDQIELLKNQQSVVFWDGKICYIKSTAALQIVRKLDAAWPVLYCFVIIPRFIRDFFYDLISINRYRWFGKSECIIPIDFEIKDRLLN